MGRFVLIFALFTCAAHAQLVTYCSGVSISGSGNVSVTTNNCPGGTATFNTPVGAQIVIDTVVEKTVTSITDVAGDTIVPIETCSGGATSKIHQLWWVASSLGSSVNSVTANYAATGDAEFIFASVYTDMTGLDTTIGCGYGGPSGNPSTASFSTPHNNDRVIASCYFDNQTIPGIPAPYLSIAPLTSSQQIWDAAAVFAAPQTGIAATMTNT